MAEPTWAPRDGPPVGVIVPAGDGAPSCARAHWASPSRDRPATVRRRQAMPFTALFIAHAPDADPARHRALVDTGLYRLFSVVVRDTDQAVAVCRELVAGEGVQSILLCPGNTIRMSPRSPPRSATASRSQWRAATPAACEWPPRPWRRPAGSLRRRPDRHRERPVCACAQRIGEQRHERVGREAPRARRHGTSASRSLPRPLERARPPGS